MNFEISDKAAALYKNEMGLIEGDALRLFVRVGGCGSGGFSVGVTKEKPSKSAATKTVDGIDFFVEEEDFWYLNGMKIDFNEDLNYVTFENPKLNDLDNPNS